MKRIILAAALAAGLAACTQKPAGGTAPPATATTAAPGDSAAAADTAADGEQYTDFEMPNMAGTPVRLSSYVSRNRYTLIDFWASWCGPCRREMPTVVKAYNTFHGKGLEVVGVSLDQDRQAWQQAVGDLGMAWPQLSDLRGWECAAAQLYKVHSIPSSLLVDQQGRIVARDLRGDDLLSTLARLMP